MEVKFCMVVRTIKDQITLHSKGHRPIYRVWELTFVKVSDLRLDILAGGS